MTDKFAEFNLMCKGEEKNIIVAGLEVLGDTVKEMEDNIIYALDNGCTIHIASLDCKIVEARIQSAE